MRDQDSSIPDPTTQGHLPRVVQRGVWGVAALVVVLGTLGVAATSRLPAWKYVDLDGEINVPAAVSALLLGWCAVAAAALGWRDRRRLLLWPLAALFAVMAVDESFSLHERLEVALRVDWQVLYSPLVAVAALAWACVTWRLRERRAFLVPWVAGALAWGCAQGLEALQWDGDDEKRAGYTAMMVTEELLEMTGSAAWGTALAVEVVTVVGGLAAWRLRRPQPWVGVVRSSPVPVDSL